MDKFGMGVLVALVFAAILAAGVAIVMFWTALMYELFGYFAPIGFWQSALLTILTSSAFGIVLTRSSVTLKKEG